MANMDTRIYKLLYPMPPLHRPRTKPMKVLALGLPRSGTESLRHALLELGFKGVYHGFDAVANPSESAIWVELWDKKQRGDTLTAADFDRVLGHCEAVTELPGCIFARELLAAYPHARVVANYRASVDAWHRSIVNTWSKGEMGLGGRVCFWTLCWFRAPLFWIGRQHVAITEDGFLTRDYRGTARAYYAKHYAMLDAVAKAEPGRVLRWKVEDGWAPLCEFVGRPVPLKAFPHTHANDAAADRVVGLVRPHILRAVINMFVLVCFVFFLGLKAGLLDSWKVTKE